MISGYHWRSPGLLLRVSYPALRNPSFTPPQTWDRCSTRHSSWNIHVPRPWNCREYMKCRDNRVAADCFLMRWALRLTHYYTDPSTRVGWFRRYDRINKISQSVKYCIKYMLRSSWMRQRFRNMVNDLNAKWHWIYISYYWSHSQIYLKSFPLSQMVHWRPLQGLPKWDDITLNFFSPMFVRLKAQSVVCLILYFPKIYEHFWGPKKKR